MRKHPISSLLALAATSHLAGAFQVSPHRYRPPKISRQVSTLHLVRRGEDEETAVVPPDVAIRSSKDLPQLPPDCLVEVYHAEQIIQELGTVSELVETYHSGLIFRLKDKAQSVPEEFTVQWYAFDFPFGAFLPKMTDDSAELLLWDNTACAHYTPAVDPHRWTKGEQLVGTITGKDFNDFSEWTVEYCRSRPGYQAFEVWDRPLLVSTHQPTKKWASSNTCSSFTEAALDYLYQLGADFSSGKQILRRSYCPLISKTQPTKVNMNDSKEAMLVRDFYGLIQTAVCGESMTTSEFIRFLADKLDVFYVYEAETDRYLRVELSPPYLALANLYQPMTLPWQEGNLEAQATAEGEEEIIEGYMSELSAAASGGRDILKRRLPSVLARRFGWRSVVGLALVPLAIVFGLTTTNGGGITMDESFLQGVGVGLAAGLIGSRLLP